MDHVSTLSERVVIVTGGTRGIGLGISRAFLALGDHVVVCARKTPEVLPEHGGNSALFLEADVRQPENIKAVVEECQRSFGGINVLINNAGGSPFADAATASPRFSSAVIDLNLVAPLNFAQAVNAVMQNQEEGGVIVNVASVSGTRPSPGTAAYGAAKAGLLNLTQSLAIEWAPKVRVNAVVPGLIRTEQSHLHYGDEAGCQRVAQSVPLGRLGTPEDVANACVFLASAAASYISGADLLVHGGGEEPAFLGAARAGKT